MFAPAFHSTGFQIFILLVYFLYGLAFFSMGLTMLLEVRRSPLLAEGGVLAPLAVFGFVHGTHEWLEMAILTLDWAELPIPGWSGWARLFFLVFSFSALLLFSLRVLRPQHRKLMLRDWIAGGGLLAGYLLLVVLTSLWHHSSLTHWMGHADALARYFLAVPGAILAALAFNRQALQAAAQQRPALRSSLLLAALGFGIYGLTQLVVAPSDVLFGQLLNTTRFLEWTGIPVQAIRAGLAVLILVALIRASQLVDVLRQRQLAAAQEARLQAMEQVQRELLEREALRRELLRHIVIAQEDERSRISRELHDETAQYLTAMSLNLAALQNKYPASGKIQTSLERLQALYRDMSRGIQRMVRDLRPAQLDDLGLVAAFQYLADEERHHAGLKVSVQVQGEPRRLDPLFETVFFRVAQEALTNVVRHAQCGQASIQFHFAPAYAELSVIDQGVGFDPQAPLVAPHGWGLAGMRERVESVGGKLTIISAPGSGTRVVVSIPLESPGDSNVEENEHDNDKVNVG